MKSIDLRSDTITTPTPEMREAMSSAEVGDDVFGEDPTVNRLEILVARKLGKESALFTASGTMSNLLAVMAQTRRGDEIILGDLAHIFWNEVGGAAAIGGVVMRLVKNNERGEMAPEEVENAVRPSNLHYPPTTLLCLENTHNRCSGAVLTPEYTRIVAEKAHRQGLKVHLDGARIFNAAVALGVPVSDLTGPADSVSCCLSKGLSAPVGSLLAGSRETIERARKMRKMLGGGMRQAGVIAAAGLVAVERMVDRLQEDHAHARRLVAGLETISGISVYGSNPLTNIVMFQPPSGIEAAGFIETMAADGVKFTYPGGRWVRAVTHRLISADDIDIALERIRAALAGRQVRG